MSKLPTWVCLFALSLGGCWSRLEQVTEAELDLVGAWIHEASPPAWRLDLEAADASGIHRGRMVTPGNCSAGCAVGFVAMSNLGDGQVQVDVRPVELGSMPRAPCAVMAADEMTNADCRAALPGLGDFVRCATPSIEGRQRFCELNFVRGTFNAELRIKASDGVARLVINPTALDVIRGTDTARLTSLAGAMVRSRSAPVLPAMLNALTCGNGVVDRGEDCDPGCSGNACVPGVGEEAMCPPSCRLNGACGNGVVEEPVEQCDDGPANRDEQDACRQGSNGRAVACHLPTCGDGIRDSLERCDLDDPPGVDCRIDRTDSLRCTYCGDGTHDPPEEACDTGDPPGVECRLADCHYCGDGVRNGPETCDRSDPPGVPCRSEDCHYCGDGVRNGPESCDTMDPPTVTCRADCTYCGDGVRNGGESCDTGDPPAVGCRSDCGYCGDAVKNGPESCDGNDPAGVACRNDCTYCGDGVRNGAEACDTDDPPGAGCRSDCTRCGDGVRNGTETCDGFDPPDVQCRASCTYCGDRLINDQEICDDGPADAFRFCLGCKRGLGRFCDQSSDCGQLGAGQMFCGSPFVPAGIGVCSLDCAGSPLVCSDAGFGTVCARQDGSSRKACVRSCRTAGDCGQGSTCCFAVCSGNTCADLGGECADGRPQCNVGYCATSCP